MKILPLLLFLLPLQLMSQDNIIYYRDGIKYISCPIHFQSKEISKPTDIDTLVFKGIPRLKDYTILFKELTPRSSQIFIYKDTALIHFYDLPFHKWFSTAGVLVVDFDNNKYPDIRIDYLDYDSAMLENRVHKVYLFNLGSTFKMIQFFDIETDREKDINKDGKLEILSCDKINLNNKDYWVYNAFYFQDGELRNVSKSLGYPRWYKSRLTGWTKPEPANIPVVERQKGYRELPNGYVSQ